MSREGVTENNVNQNCKHTELSKKNLEKIIADENSELY